MSESLKSLKAMARNMQMAGLTVSLSTTQWSIEEIERLRHLAQCCERDNNYDGNCDRHPNGLRGEVERLQSQLQNESRMKLHATIEQQNDEIERLKAQHAAEIRAWQRVKDRAWKRFLNRFLQRRRRG